MSGRARDPKRDELLPRHSSCDTKPATLEGLVHASRAVGKRADQPHSHNRNHTSRVQAEQSMADKTPTTSESRLERHMNSKFAAKHLFAEHLIQKATLPTRGNLTLAYVVHESETKADAGTNGEDETRVVLIMGYSYRKEEWAPTIDGLLSQWKESGPQSKLKVLTLDNRGVGHSDAPWGRYSTQMMAEDTLALMDHLGWTKAHIVGVSMGGMISQELVLKAPQRVQSLTLMVTSQGKFCPEYTALGQIVKSTFSRDQEVITSNVIAFLYPKPFVNTPLSGGRTMRNVLREYHMSGNATRGPPGAAGTFGQSVALIFHYVDDARLVPIKDHGYPILIIGCTEDQAIVFAHTQKLQKLLTGDHVKSKIYDDAGHALFIQHIDEVASDILGVVRRGRK